MTKRRNELNKKNLKYRYKYNRDNGHFYSWRSGRRVGSQRKDGYIMLPWYDNQLLYGHRAAYILMTGEDIPEGMVIDHKDGCRHNNAWKNLRLASAQLNATNMKVRANSTTGVQGVTQEPHGWRARITVYGSRINLGTFPTREDAIKARLEAEERYNYTSRNLDDAKESDPTNLFESADPLSDLGDK